MERTIHPVDAGSQGDHLIAVKRNVRVGRPAQPARRVFGGQRKLVPPKLNLPDVVAEKAKPGLLGDLYVIEQIGGAFGVEIINKLDAVVEQAQVQAHVELPGGFPA